MQLHRKYAADGLVVMSLSVEPEDWKAKDKVLKFLTDKQADFPNYVLLDRPQKVQDWLERYGVNATPAVLLFDRDGKRVPVPDFDTEEQEEAFVRKALGK